MGNKNNSNYRRGNMDKKVNNNSYSSKNRRTADTCKGGKILDPAHQDPMWYANNTTAVSNMASLPWNEIVGSRIEYSQIGTSFSNDRVPGTIVIPFVPVPGSDTERANSTLNRAASAYFQYLTQGFTGSLDVEAPDLFMTAIAATTAIAALLDLKRAFGATNYSLTYNLYYPRVLVQSLGYDYDDLVNHKAEIRTQYNIWVRQINASLVVPKSFTWATRLHYLCSYLFTETENPEYAAVYAFQPTHLLKYSGFGMTTGTALEFTKFHQGTAMEYEHLTWEEVKARIDNLLNVLINDSDVRNMFGALRRVYADSDLISLSEIGIDDTTPVVYNPVVLNQIHNGITYDNLFGTINESGDLVPFHGLGSDPDSTTPIYGVYQDTNGNIVSTIWGGMYGDINASPIKGPTRYKADKYEILDLPANMVDPGNVLDTIAGMAIQDNYVAPKDFTFGAETATVKPIIARSEIWLRPIIISSTQDTSVLGEEVASEIPMLRQGSVIDSMTAKSVAMMSKCSYHPMIKIHAIVGSDKGLYTAYNIGNMHKYTMVGNDTLCKMHRASMYQLFSLPANTKSVTKR